ncbi:MAG: hypothetical protein KKC76_08740 [Proteobacteria bacterium]|nr:hypothetical protein [Pseudomonadota bacterium]MBU4295597.1 hypothetical protein [Pseudomonadota bacterium]MCG2747353.1 hypothetical protein [Desulfobulbaceae bacterium]
MGRYIVRKGKFILAVSVVMACWWCISASTSAQTIKVRRMAPPEDAFQLVLGPNNTATLILAPENNAMKGPVKLSLRSFWTRDDASVDVVFKSRTITEVSETPQVEFGEPVILQVTNVAGNQADTVAEIPMMWGYINASYDDEKNSVSLPVAIGAFGPALKYSGTLSIPATGRYKLELDMSNYLAFGNAATFQLTSFSSGAHDLPPRFLSAKTKAVDSLTVNFSADNPTVWLEIDAEEFQYDTEYRGALRMMINGRQFIDRPLVFKRLPWVAETSFSPIQPTIATDNKAVLAIRAASNKTIRGIFVTNATAPMENFNPRTDLDVKLNGVSLWPEDADKNQAIQTPSLAPGEIKEIIVKPHRNLPAGKHDVSLVVGALNVGVDKGAEAKITFVVRNHWIWAVAVLVLSVMMSYIITKGIVTLINRRNLKKRVADIKNESWLKDDRWGALPIVRAFVRVALADKALNEKVHLKHLITFFSRMVTTPQLISDEIKEVDKRLEIYKKLNKHAIYWGAAPSDVCGTSGMDNRIIWRARKGLREIVDQLSRLYKSEDIPTELIAKIDRMEKWYREDSLKTEYWASLLKDINWLLMQIDLHHFEFDQLDLDKIVENLNAIKQINHNQAINDAAISSLAACHVFKEKGIPALTEAMQPITALLDDTSVTNQQLIGLVTQIHQCCLRLSLSGRETARELVEKLSPKKTPPDSMIEILAMEDNYIRLKLLWEQRSYPDRCRTLVKKFHDDMALGVILKEFDDEIWELLKEPGTLRITNPASIGPVEQYALTDFKVECANPKADTFLFKHGVQYEWRIEYGGEKQKPLTPVTRCPVVTQFIPQIDENKKVKVFVDIYWGNDKFSVKNDESDHVSFTTLLTKRYKNLWPTNTPELLGVAIALALALVAGFQSDAFINALQGSWKEYLTLFAWGVGAEQTKTLIQNLEKPFKTGQAES